MEDNDPRQVIRVEPRRPRKNRHPRRNEEHIEVSVSPSVSLSESFDEDPWNATFDESELQDESMILPDEDIEDITSRLKSSTLDEGKQLEMLRSLVQEKGFSWEDFSSGQICKILEVLMIFKENQTSANDLVSSLVFRYILSDADALIVLLGIFEYLHDAVTNHVNISDEDNMNIRIRDDFGEIDRRKLYNLFERSYCQQLLEIRSAISNDQRAVSNLVAKLTLDLLQYKPLSLVRSGSRTVESARILKILDKCSSFVDPNFNTGPLRTPPLLAFLKESKNGDEVSNFLNILYQKTYKIISHWESRGDKVFHIRRRFYSELTFSNWRREFESQNKYLESFLKNEPSLSAKQISQKTREVILKMCPRLNEYLGNSMRAPEIFGVDKNPIWKDVPGLWKNKQTPDPMIISEFKDALRAYKTKLKLTLDCAIESKFTQACCDSLNELADNNKTSGLFHRSQHDKIALIRCNTDISVAMNHGLVFHQVCGEDKEAVAVEVGLLSEGYFFYDEEQAASEGGSDRYYELFYYPEITQNTLDKHPKCKHIPSCALKTVFNKLCLELQVREKPDITLMASLVDPSTRKNIDPPVYTSVPTAYCEATEASANRLFTRYFLLFEDVDDVVIKRLESEIDFLVKEPISIVATLIGFLREEPSPSRTKSFDFFEAHPEVASYASPDILSALEPKSSGCLLQAFKDHWWQRIGGVYLQHDTSMSHVRYVVHSLMTENHSGDFPRCTIQNAFTSKHMKKLIKLCGFRARDISVEDSNVATVGHQLESLGRSCLNFMFIEIVGEINNESISRLIESATGSLRLVLLSRPDLKMRIGLIGKEKYILHLPPKQSSHPDSEESIRTKYNKFSESHYVEALTHVARNKRLEIGLNQHVCTWVTMGHELWYPNISLLKSRLVQSGSWLDELKRWNTRGISLEDPSSFCAVVIGQNEKQLAQQVCAELGGLGSQSFDALKEFDGAMDVLSLPDGEDSEYHPPIVIYNAVLCEPDTISQILSRGYRNNHQVVFVSICPTFSLCKPKLIVDDAHAIQCVCKVLRKETVLQKDDLDSFLDHCLSFSSGSVDKNPVLFLLVKILERIHKLKHAEFPSTILSFDRFVYLVPLARVLSMMDRLVMWLGYTYAEMAGDCIVRDHDFIKLMKEFTRGPLLPNVSLPTLEEWIFFTCPEEWEGTLQPFYGYAEFVGLTFPCEEALERALFEGKEVAWQEGESNVTPLHRLGASQRSHMLRYCSDRVRLLLSFNYTGLINERYSLLDAQSLQVVVEDLLCVSPLLEVTFNRKEFSDQGLLHLSAVKLLISVHESWTNETFIKSIETSFKMFDSTSPMLSPNEKEITLLNQHGITLEFRKTDQTFLEALKSLCKSDAPGNLLLHQQHICTFLSEETEELRSFLKSGDLVIGRQFIELLFTAVIKDCTQDRPCHPLRQIVPLFCSVVGAENSLLTTDLVLTKLPVSLDHVTLTPGAWAQLLCHISDKSSFLEKVLVPQLYNENYGIYGRTIQFVFDQLLRAELSKKFAFEFLLLLDEDVMPQLEDSVSVCLASMVRKSDSLSDDLEKLKLSNEGSKLLIKAYAAGARSNPVFMKHFLSMLGHCEQDIETVILLFMEQVSNLDGSVVDYIATKSPGEVKQLVSNSPCLSFLLWYCWILHPESELASSPKSDQELKAFSKLLDTYSETFIARCTERKKYISSTAIYILDPDLLSSELFTRLNSDFKMYPNVDEKFVLIAEQPGDKFPSYYTRCSFRPLSSSRIESIKGELERGIETRYSDSFVSNYREQDPMVMYGVSINHLLHNLDLARYYCLNDAQGNTDPTRRGQNMMCLRLYLYSAGLLGVFESCLKKLLKDESRMKQFTMQEKKLTANYAFGPIPPHIATHWIGDSQDSLLKLNSDSVRTTVACFNNLIRHFRCDNESMAFFTAEDLCDIKSRAAGPRFSNAHIELAAFCGSQTAARVARNLNSNLNYGEKGATLVRFISPFGDLYSTLWKQYPEKSDAILTAFCSGVEKRSKVANFEYISAIIHQMVFQLFGFNSINQGREIVLVSNYYLEHDAFYLDSRTVAELRWFCTYFFVEANKKLEIVADGNVERLLKSLLERIEKNKERIQFWSCSQDNARNDSHEIDTKIPLPNPKPNDSIVAELHSEFHSRSSSNAQVVSRKSSPVTMKKTIFKALKADSANHADLDFEIDYDNLEANCEPECGVIDMSEVIQLEHHQLFSCIRVKPALFPIMVRPIERGHRYAHVYILNRVLKFATSHSKVAQIFSNNGEVHEMLSGLGEGAVVIADGLQLYRTSRAWLPVLHLPVKDQSDRWGAPHGVWRLLNTYFLGGYDLDENVLRLIQIIVWGAFQITRVTQDLEGDQESEEDEEVRLEISELMDGLGESQSIGLVLEQLPEVLKEIHSCSRDSAFGRRYSMMEDAFVSLIADLLPDCVNSVNNIENKLFQKSKLFPYIHSLITNGPSMNPLGHVLALQFQNFEAVDPGSTRGELIAALVIFHRNLFNEGQAFAGRDYSRVKEQVDSGRLAITRSTRVNIKKFANACQQSLPTVKVVLPRSMEPIAHFLVVSDRNDDQRRLEFVKNTVSASDDDAREISDLVTCSKADCSHSPCSSAWEEHVVHPKDKHGLFGNSKSWGVGQQEINKFMVHDMWDQETTCFYIPLDVTSLNMRYTPSEGLPIGFLFHKNILHRILCNLSYDDISRAFQSLIEWITLLLRSPLSTDMKKWFLYQLAKPCTLKPPLAESDANCRMLSYGVACMLGTNVPELAKIRAKFVDLFQPPEDIACYLQRKTDKYGIQVVSASTMVPKLLQDAGVEVKVIAQEGSLYASAQADIRLYIEIIRSFSRSCCVVYVQNLRTISDTLLKWMAEHTAMFPWRFIFLENTDISWNFCENRDRCITHTQEGSLQKLRTLKELTISDFGLRKYHDVEFSTISIIETSWNSLGELSKLKELAEIQIKSPPMEQFEDQVKALQQKSILRLLLVSPPGTGKTHFIEEHFKQDSMMIDGSSDIFISKTMLDVLRSKSLNGGMLVVDEYHMLSDAHKKELCTWARHPSQSSISLVLIANRIDELDRHLASNADNPEVQPLVTIIETRLTARKIIDVIGRRFVGSPTSVTRCIAHFLRVVRLIMGNETISLRWLDPLKKEFEAWASESKSLNELTISLISHCMSISPTTSITTITQVCGAFVRALETILADKPTIEIASAALQQSVGGTLVALSLLDTNDDLVPIPDFIPCFHRSGSYCPSVTLAAWCACVYRATGCKLPISMQCFKRTVFVSQLGFPFQLEESARSVPLINGLAFSWHPSGDLSDSLSDIIAAVKHGHAVNWKSLGEHVWSDVSNYIRNIKSLNRMISSTSSKRECLAAISRENLCDRLRDTDAESVLVLSKTVLTYVPCTTSIGDDIFNTMKEAASISANPFFLALWNVIRLTGDLTFETLSKQIKECLALQQYETHVLLGMLLWMVRSAIGLMHVESIENTEQLMGKVLFKVFETCSKAGRFMVTNSILISQISWLFLWNDDELDFNGDLLESLFKSVLLPHGLQPHLITLWRLFNGEEATAVTVDEIENLFDSKFRKFMLTDNQLRSSVARGLLANPSAKVPVAIQALLLSCEHAELLGDRWTTPQAVAFFGEGLSAMNRSQGKIHMRCSPDILEAFKSR